MTSQPPIRQSEMCLWRESFDPWQVKTIKNIKPFKHDKASYLPEKHIAEICILLASKKSKRQIHWNKGTCLFLNIYLRCCLYYFFVINVFIYCYVTWVSFWSVREQYFL